MPFSSVCPWFSPVRFEKRPRQSIPLEITQTVLLFDFQETPVAEVFDVSSKTQIFSSLHFFSKGGSETT